MSGPWEKFQEVPAEPQAEGPWSKFQEASAASPDDWQARVKPIDLGNGKQSVQREDGGVWFGPDQGNTGKPGWFDAKGMRLGDAPGQPTGFMDRLTNDLQAKGQQERQRSFAGGLVPMQIGGMTGGLVKGGMAAAQLGAQALGSSAMDRPVEQYNQFQRENFGDQPVMEAVGQVAPFVGSGGASAAPQALSNIQKVRAILAGIGKAGATGAVAAPALSGEEGVTGPADFWQRKLEKAKLGGGIGLALGAGGQLVGAVGSRLKAALTPEAQAIQDLGDQFGVRTLAPDLTASPGLNKAAVLAEQVPGSGMVKQRLAQQAEAKAAAEKLLAQHGIEGDASTKIQEGLQKRLASAKASAKAAYDHVGQLAEGKGDVPLDETLKAIQQFKAQEAAAVVPDQGLVALLDKMEGRIKAGQAGKFTPPQESPVFMDWFKGSTATDASGNPLVFYHGTNSGEEIARTGGFKQKNGMYFFTPDADTASAWAHGKSALHGGNPSVSPVNLSIKNPADVVFRPGIKSEINQIAKGHDGVIIRDQSGAISEVVVFDPSQIKSATSGWWSTPTAQAPGVDLSYQGVRGLRSDLGSMISDYYKGTNAATGSKGVQVLQGVKNAIEGDLNAFTAKNGPEIASAAKRADAIYKGEVVPFKDKALAAAVKSSEPDQIYRTFIQQGKGDRAQKFYNALDPEGQAAVRSQMVKDAFNKATERDGVFSPAKFAQSLEKIKDASGVFFKGQDKFELDGFTNLMRHIQRAGQVAENPPTGQRLILAALAGEGAGTIGRLAGHGPEAGVAGVATAGTAMASARMLTKLFSSKAGKSLLLAASDAPVGSTAMERIIEKDLPKLMGAAPNVAPLRTIPQAASTGTSDQIVENK